MQKDILILGMGNTLLGDDGAGIYIVNELEKIIGARQGIDFECISWGGFRVIDVLKNYKTAIVIDAINYGEKPEGYIHITGKNNFLSSVRMVSFHDINFAIAVEFAERLNIPVPEKFYVYGIEVRNTESFSENLSPAVKLAAEKCIDMVIDKIIEIDPKIIINEKFLQI
jgi:hydrogenase maturation protease